VANAVLHVADYVADHDVAADLSELRLGACNANNHAVHSHADNDRDYQ
jgi:hypothetical protein